MTNTVLLWNKLKHICHTEINSVQTKTPFQQHISPTSKQLDMKTKPHLMPLLSGPEQVTGNILSGVLVFWKYP